MKINWNKKYTTYAIYAAGVSAIVIFFAFVGVYIRSVWGGILWIIDVIAPLLYGFVIAYILSPVLNFFERRIFRKIRHGVVRRGVAVFCTYLIFIVAFGLLIYMVAPQLAHSFNDLQSNLALYTRSLEEWLTSVSQRSDFFASIVAKLMEFIDFSTLQSPLTGLIELLYDLVQNSAPIVMGFFTTIAVQLKNIIIGLVFSGYLLCSKELVIAQTNKLMHVFLKEKQISGLKKAIAYTDRTFGKYIIGTLTDAIIVGILTAIALLICRMPYVPLISVLIACTNIIPIFGPFIGGIPSFIFIFIADPIKAIWFVVIILAIQQIDGNFIAPRILGNSTGLPAMFVIIAITVMGGLFGLVGMVIAVPVFAILGKVITVTTEKRAAAKNAADGVDKSPDDNPSSENSDASSTEDEQNSRNDGDSDKPNESHSGKSDEIGNLSDSCKSDDSDISTDSDSSTDSDKSDTSDNPTAPDIPNVSENDKPSDKENEIATDNVNPEENEFTDSDAGKKRFRFQKSKNLSISFQENAGENPKVNTDNNDSDSTGNGSQKRDPDNSQANLTAPDDDREVNKP